MGDNVTHPAPSSVAPVSLGDFSNSFLTGIVSTKPLLLPYSTKSGVKDKSTCFLQPCLNAQKSKNKNEASSCQHYKITYDMAPSFLQLHSFSLTNPASALLVRFFKDIQTALNSGPLHFLCPLLGMLFSFSFA